MYEPRTPHGYGDQFYMYVYRPSANGFSTGQTGNLIPIEIQDADFVCRAYAGADSVLLTGAPLSGNGTIQVYDKLTRGIYNLPTIIPGQFSTGQAMTPERLYPTNSALRFDLNNMSLATNVSGPNTVPVDQLVFYGVRRWKGAKSDPEPSPTLSRYYEKEYDIPFNFTLAANGLATGPGGFVQFTSVIQDFDFELRRIEGMKITGGVYANLSATNPEFSMRLYDAHWVQRSNGAVHSNRLIHFPLSRTNPQNTWPTPALVYPVNSVLRFDVGSLIPTGATLPTINLLFKGVRRIPCM